MIGVCTFATPCSEAIRRFVFGKEFVDHVTEFHRLHILDCTPKNTESWFISRCLKRLKQDNPIIWGVITYADSTEGHNGTIYKATNAIPAGTTTARKFYLDQDGRLRHPRQCGVNISTEEARRRGWKPVTRGSKYRFIYLLPDSHKHKRLLMSCCKFTNPSVSQDDRANLLSYSTTRGNDQRC